MKKQTDGRYEIKQTFEINGKKVRKSFKGRTQAEVKQKLADYIRSQDETKITFRDAFKQYKLVEETRIKPTEYQTKCERIEAFTNIMDARLIAITPQMIALDLNKVARSNPRTKKPTSKRTLTRYLQAVSNVFEYAEENRLTTYNPCKYVKVPTDAPQSQREALSPTEYKSILANDNPSLFGIKFLILTGLRKGEAAALQWRDIFDDSVVNVNKSYNYKNNTIKLPKSTAGIRQVPIPPSIQSELKSANFGKKPSDYVFTYKDRQMTLNDWKNYVDDAKAITGIDFTLHQLRHTTATIYYYSGIPVKECQEYMGHSTIRITLDIYTSLEKSDRVKKSSIDKLDKFLANL